MHARACNNSCLPLGSAPGIALSAAVAQLVRALDCGSRGRRFETPQRYQVFQALRACAPCPISSVGNLLGNNQRRNIYIMSTDIKWSASFKLTSETVVGPCPIDDTFCPVVVGIEPLGPCHRSAQRPLRFTPERPFQCLRRDAATSASPALLDAHGSAQRGGPQQHGHHAQRGGSAQRGGPQQHGDAQRGGSASEHPRQAIAVLLPVSLVQLWPAVKQVRQTSALRQQKTQL